MGIFHIRCILYSGKALVVHFAVIVFALVHFVRGHLGRVAENVALARFQSRQILHQNRAVQLILIGNLQLILITRNQSAGCILLCFQFEHLDAVLHIAAEHLNPAAAEAAAAVAVELVADAHGFVTCAFFGGRFHIPAQVVVSFLVPVVEPATDIFVVVQSFAHRNIAVRLFDDQIEIIVKDHLAVLSGLRIINVRFKGEISRKWHTLQDFLIRKGHFYLAGLADGIAAHNFRAAVNLTISLFCQGQTIRQLVGQRVVCAADDSAAYEIAQFDLHGFAVLKPVSILNRHPVLALFFADNDIGDVIRQVYSAVAPLHCHHHRVVCILFQCLTDPLYPC